MYIEIAGTSYFLSIRDTEKNVTLIGRKDDVIHIAVSAQLSKEELHTYLKSSTFSKTIKDFDLIAKQQTSISLFELQFSIILKAGIDIPYSVGKSIYVPNKVDSAAALDRLSEILLLQEIKQHVSFWEDNLDVLINDIHLRKLKRNFFTTNKKTNSLTFDKMLCRRSKGFIAYICAVACFDYVHLENDKRELFSSQHISDWKHHHRVLSYEMGI